MEAELYRKLAEHCLDRADLSSNFEARKNIMSLALFWVAKAEQAEAGGNRVIAGPGLATATGLSPLWPEGAPGDDQMCATLRADDASLCQDKKKNAIVFRRPIQYPRVSGIA